MTFLIDVAVFWVGLLLCCGAVQIVLMIAGAIFDGEETTKE